jgi:hypothetical protein
LAVFGWASTLLFLVGLGNASSHDWLGAVVIGTGSAGVVLTLGAWRRRVWGYRGLLILAGTHNILALLTFVLGRHVGILGPMLFDAAALALFSLRRWYGSSATSA